MGVWECGSTVYDSFELKWFFIHATFFLSLVNRCLAQDSDHRQIFLNRLNFTLFFFISFILQPAMEATQQQPVIVIVPSPGLGHLIPLTEFSKRLVLLDDFTVTFFIPSDTSSPTTLQKTILQTLPATISAVFLPPVHLPATVSIESRLSLTLIQSLPALRSELNLLRQLSPPAALVVDFFGTDAFDLAAEFNIPAYLFNLTSANNLSLALNLPKLDEEFSRESRDLPDPIRLPGCVPLRRIDMPDPLQDRKSEAYQVVLRKDKRYLLSAGILVNSFIDLEAGAFQALRIKGEEMSIPPVYPIGPLTLTNSGEDSGDECLGWLDLQPSQSVLYVSFGSGGTLSQKQLTELALGLELSKQRFLWVVRSPNDESANANFFDSRSSKNPIEILPEGFIERTKHVGLVVPSWAPQIQILGHESTGGFLSHCGWNSILESVVNGVPVIAWPLFAEQKMNAVLMAEELKVAVRVEGFEDGVIGRVKVAEYVSNLMEGDEGKVTRKKMMKLKEKAKMSLGCNGSSSEMLGHVAEIWRKG